MLSIFILSVPAGVKAEQSSGEPIKGRLVAAIVPLDVAPITDAVLELHYITEGGRPSSVGGMHCDIIETEGGECSGGEFSFRPGHEGRYVLVVWTMGMYQELEIDYNARVGKDLGIIKLMPRPLDVMVETDTILAEGGWVNVRVKVQSNNSLNLVGTALVARTRVFGRGTTQWSVNYDVEGGAFYGTWPSGPVPVLPAGRFNVESSLPSGSEFCAVVTIELSGRPDIVLGSGSKCSYKQIRTIPSAEIPVTDKIWPGPGL